MTDNILRHIFRRGSISASGLFDSVFGGYSHPEYEYEQLFILQLNH